MAKVHKQAKITQIERIADGVVSMRLLAPEIAMQATPGQFVSLYTKDSDKLLPRPISLCEIDKERGQIRLVYRIVGAGTTEFAKRQVDDEICIMGPLGHGFPLEACKEDAHGILIGGGIGIPPILQLAKELKGHVTVVLGYRDSQTFLLSDFQKVTDQVVIATEDGSVGVRGNVIDAINDAGLKGDVVYSCGPTPMLRGVKAWGLETGTPAYLSLEEKMACGIGACLACVCDSTEVDDHSKVKNKRICKDGPVFLSTDIQL